MNTDDERANATTLLSLMIERHGWEQVAATMADICADRADAARAGDDDAAAAAWQERADRVAAAGRVPDPV